MVFVYQWHHIVVTQSPNKEQTDLCVCLLEWLCSETHVNRRFRWLRDKSQRNAPPHCPAHTNSPMQETRAAVTHPKTLKVQHLQYIHTPQGDQVFAQRHNNTHAHAVIANFVQSYAQPTVCHSWLDVRHFKQKNVLVDSGGVFFSVELRKRSMRWIL